MLAVKDHTEPLTPSTLTPNTLSPRTYTPKHLAEKILTSRSALEGERKQVTVLFADVKSSMELAEQLDPEEWHRILERFFAILTDGVHRFEGTVNQYTGDGIMALFGAPLAHEDHAQRACYAALHLQDELRRYADDLRVNQGLNFAVRMGLNSGEVLVGKIGDDLRMDYTAQGHTVGLAARMEQIAAADRVNLTGHTARLVEGYFRLRDLGPLPVKGAHEQVRVYELQGVGPLRTRLDVSRARGFSKFVGRADEMAALEAALERTIQGHGQVIGVVGEAGVGKSRLCYEFVRGCRARGLTVTEAHGVAHGKGNPFLVVLEYLRSYFGTTDQDTDQRAREKIAGKLLLLDPEFNDALPLLFDFLGVPDPERAVPRMDAEARQRQLFSAMKHLTHAQSRREPGISIVEDLHWIDAASEAFLENFIEALAGTRTLLVVNFRPEYHADWMQRSYYQQMALLPLGAEAIAELLRDLLGSDPSLAGLADRLRERTGGNPFFIEEMVQSLAEAGCLEGSRGAYRLARAVDEVAIPASVQVVLAARIDRLAEQQKQVLQTASVIGRKFSEPILKGVAELPETDLAASLGCLERAEFVYEEALYPEAVYAFKHALTQEVAYRSQRTERRARVHGAVARTLAELYPERLNEQAALIAHHWEEAGDALEAARWHSRAAAWAGTSHLAEALRHWRRVRALLEHIPESAETLVLGVTARIQMLNVAWRLGAPEDEAAAIFAEGKALAERSGDLRGHAHFVVLYGTVRGLGGDLDVYLNSAVEAARLADQTDDAGLKAACRSQQILSHFYAGRLSDALLAAEEALAQTPGDPTLGRDIFGFCPHIFAFCWRGLTATQAGRHAEAEANLDRALELARQHGDAEVLGWAHTCYAWLARYTGRPGAALSHARRAVEIAERIGSPLSRVNAYASLGVAHVVAEEWGDAAAVLDRALEVARKTRVFFLVEADVLVALAEAYLGLGEGSRARAAADEALVVACRRGTKVWECGAHLTRARVLLRTEGAGAAGDIQSALGEAQALVEQTGGRSLEPLIHEERAELARLVGDDATRERELREAHRLFTEMGATAHAERVAKELEKSKVTRPAPAAEKPIAKGNTQGAKAGRTTKRVRQTAGRRGKE